MLFNNGARVEGFVYLILPQKDAIEMTKKSCFPSTIDIFAGPHNSFTPTSLGALVAWKFFSDDSGCLHVPGLLSLSPMATLAVPTDGFLVFSYTFFLPGSVV